MSEYLRLDRVGAVSVVTIDRRAKRNAFNLAMWESVPDVVASACSGNARVLVLRGPAGGDFSAGADISEFNALRNDLTSAERYSDVVHRAVTAVADVHIPTVAMIDGYCVGGGCELVLACDIRDATERATLGITPAKLGIAYSLASTRRLVSAVGPAMARYLLLTANLIGAGRAFEIGLVHEVYATHEYEAAGMALVERLSKLAAVSHAGSRAIISRIERGLVDEDSDVRELYRASFVSPEYREGVAAFTQNRSPDFVSVSSELGGETDGQDAAAGT